MSILFMYYKYTERPVSLSLLLCHPRKIAIIFAFCSVFENYMYLVVLFTVVHNQFALNSIIDANCEHNWRIGKIKYREIYSKKNCSCSIEFARRKMYRTLLIFKLILTFLRLWLNKHQIELAFDSDKIHKIVKIYTVRVATARQMWQVHRKAA